MDESIEAVILRLNRLMREMKVLIAQSEVIRSEAAELRKWTREVVARSRYGYPDFSSNVQRLDGVRGSRFAEAPFDDGDRGADEI